MEAAALYAFARRTESVKVLCLAHVTNTMGRTERDFEKGEANAGAKLAELVAIGINIRLMAVTNGRRLLPMLLLFDSLA